jgi:HlyD family secretion protein
MAEECPPPIPPQKEDNISFPQDRQLSITLPSAEKKAEPEESSQKIPERVIRLVPLGILAGIAVVWAFWGKILIEVEGRSVLTIPSSNIELQSRAAGKVLTVNVQPKDIVHEGQLLLTLDLPELQEMLRTEQQKLAELKGENLTVTEVQNQRTQLKRETLQRQGEAIPREIASLQRQITSNLRQIESNQIQLDANRRQREAYRQRVTQLNTINHLIREKLEAYQKIAKEGVIAPLSGDLIRAVQAEQENRNTITTLTAQIEDTQANDAKLQADNKSLMAQNSDLNAKIKDQNANSEDLKTQNRQLDLEDTEANITRRNAITDKERDIANLLTKIATERKIFSPYNGRILDIAVNPSQYIAIGARLGTIQVKDRQQETVGVMFFKPGDADRIQVGVEMEITPDIHKRERYGGIVAIVTSISQETITPQEVARLVGNEQLALALTDNQPVVQIFAKLQRDPSTISGYKWTDGKGAPQTIPESATATARVVVEERSLVSYIVPVLRGLTGIYRN